MNRKVTEYIKKQKLPQRKICESLRILILKYCSKFPEEMKWGVPSYDSGRLYFVALKDHVNIGFLLKDLPKKILEKLEYSGKTTGHIKINSIEDLENKKISRILKSIK